MQKFIVGPRGGGGRTIVPFLNTPLVSTWRLVVSLRWFRCGVEVERDECVVSVFVVVRLLGRDWLDVIQLVVLLIVVDHLLDLERLAR